MTLERHRALDAQIRAPCGPTNASCTPWPTAASCRARPDRFSDLESWAFLDPQAGALEVRARLEALTPVEHFVVNEFGTPNAVLSGLLRAGLHAVSNTQLEDVGRWPGEHVQPDQMLIKDQGGQLAGVVRSLGGQPPTPLRRPGCSLTAR